MNPFRHIVSILLVFLLLHVPGARGAPAGGPAPTGKDKCPVCGMFVSRYPEWTAAARFADSSALYFDGAKDFFTWYHDIRRYTPSRKRDAITEISVIDYYSLKPVDARKAFFVTGSDVFGPMGKELVPFSRSEDAVEFMKDHRGKAILRFGQVTPAVLKSLE